MGKLPLSLIYLTGVLINAALLLVGVRILEAGTFSGRAGRIAAGTEALFFGLLFVALGLGGAITLLIAGKKHLLDKRESDNANGRSRR
jgi:hypothetical protein